MLVHGCKLVSVPDPILKDFPSFGTLACFLTLEQYAAKQHAMKNKEIDASAASTVESLLSSSQIWQVGHVLEVGRLGGGMFRRGAGMVNSKELILGSEVSFL